MNALILIKKNTPLNYLDTDMPYPSANQVLVQLKAAAINHRDLWIRKGIYPRIDVYTILGSDGVGLINDQAVIINPNINWGNNPTVPSSDYSILGMPEDGTFAEYIAVGKDRIHPIPTHLSYEQAAALPLGGLTAYRAVFTKGLCKSGDKVLISGIGGSVAQLAFRFAQAAGAKVYVTSSSDEKLEKALQMGAVGGANYTVQHWDKDIWAQTDGFDLIVDSAGGTGFKDLVRLGGLGGRIVVHGNTDGYFAKLNPQTIFSKQLSILGTSMGTDAEFEAMLDFVRQHKIVPVIDSVFALEEHEKAFARMRNKERFGKVVFKIE